jgi:hypothetical protein
MQVAVHYGMLMNIGADHGCPLVPTLKPVVHFQGLGSDHMALCWEHCYYFLPNCDADSLVVMYNMVLRADAAEVLRNQSNTCLVVL